MYAVVIVSSCTTQVQVYIVDQFSKGKDLLEKEYSFYIKTCYDSYITEDSTYAIIESFYGTIELMITSVSCV